MLNTEQTYKETSLSQRVSNLIFPIALSALRVETDIERKIQAVSQDEFNQFNLFCPYNGKPDLPVIHLSSLLKSEFSEYWNVHSKPHVKAVFAGTNPTWLYL